MELKMLTSFGSLLQTIHMFAPHISYLVSDENQLIIVCSINHKILKSFLTHIVIFSMPLISGERMNIPIHPDYVPSIFALQKGKKQEGKIEYYERAARRQMIAGIVKCLTKFNVT